MCAPKEGKGRKLVHAIEGPSKKGDAPATRNRGFLTLDKSGQDDVVTTRTLSCRDESEKAKLTGIVTQMAQKAGVPFDEFVSSLQFGEMLDIAIRKGIEGSVQVAIAKKVLIINEDGRQKLDALIEQKAAENEMLPMQFRIILTYPDWVGLAEEAGIQFESDLLVTSEQLTFQQAILREAMELVSKKECE